MNDVSPGTQPFTEPTQQQKDAAFAGPAPAVNRFLITMGNTGVRLSFLEDDVNGTSHFRAAVSLHPNDALNLAQTILAMANAQNQVQIVPVGTLKN